MMNLYNIEIVENIKNDKNWNEILKIFYRSLTDISLTKIQKWLKMKNKNQNHILLLVFIALPGVIFGQSNISIHTLKNLEENV